jgi:hypothetical protein
MGRSPAPGRKECGLGWRVCPWVFFSKNSHKYTSGVSAASWNSLADALVSFVDFSDLVVLRKTQFIAAARSPGYRISVATP